MKTVRSISLTLFILSLSISVSAQHNHAAMTTSSNINMNQDTHTSRLQVKTETLKVSGKCQMCKSRIEKTAIENGAASADWDLKVQMLTIVFDPSVTSAENISYKLLKAGHDSGGNRAKNKAYNALPECCKYDRISL